MCCNAPLTLRKMIMQELEVFRTLDMRVLLVFEGMPPQDLPMLSPADTKLALEIKKQRDDAWLRVANGSLAIADKDGKLWDPRLFEGVMGPRLTSDEVINEIMRTVWEHKEGRLSHVDYIRAPCTVTTQLGYLLSGIQPGTQLVHCIYAPPTAMWCKHFTAARIILEVGANEFRYLTNENALPIELPHMYDLGAKTASTDSSYNSPVYLNTDSCMVEGLQPQEKLDDLVYLFHTCGLLSTSLLTAATHAAMLEPFPAVDSKELRAVLERIIPLRTQLTCKLLPTGHHIHTPQQLKWYRWFKAPSHTDVARPPAIELDEWDVPAPTDADTITFNSVILHHSCASKNKRTYNSIPEVVTVVYLKFLDLLGYFTHSTVEDESSLGATRERSGKSVFSEALTKCRPAFSESAVLLIELIRTKGLTWEPLVDPQDGAPLTSSPFASETTNRRAALLTRLFSLAPVELKEDSNWCHHVGKDLVGFWCILRTFRVTLRHLSEVIAATSAPSDVLLDHMELLGVLPFASAQQYALGALMEYTIGMGRNFRDESIKTPEQRQKALAEAFPCFKDIKVALQTGFQWVEEAAQVVQILSEEEEPTAARDYQKMLADITKGALEMARDVNSHVLGGGPSANAPRNK
jgi:hypothetical protein